MSRPFVQILAEIDAGALLDLLSDKSAELAKAVEETGKVGQLTIVLKYKQNKGHQLIVQSEVKAKVPELGVADAVFFTNEEGDLSRRDPYQKDMFEGVRDIKSVKPPVTEDA